MENRKTLEFSNLVYNLRNAGFRIDIRNSLAISDAYDDIVDGIIAFSAYSRCNKLLSGKLVVRKLGYDWSQGFIFLSIPTNSFQTTFLIDKIREHNKGGS